MEEKVFYNTCPAAGCHQFCALKVWVRDGKISKVESADYPEEPDARCICLRGLSSIRLVYHPDRLRYPLRRVGDRGGGKWERITWDEAFDTIASKLLEIKGKYGSQSLKVISGGSSSVGLLMGRLLGRRFSNVWGAGGVFESTGWLADGGMPAASLLILGMDIRRGIFLFLSAYQRGFWLFLLIKHCLMSKFHLYVLCLRAFLPNRFK